MKLSEQLGSPETRTKKRKRELVPDDETVQNENYTLIKHLSKKNKSSTVDQDNSSIESSDKHRPNDSNIHNLDSQHDDKTSRKRNSDELLRNKKTEDSSSNENQTNECSNLNSIPSVTDDRKVSPKKNKKPKNSINQNLETVIPVPSNDATDLSTNNSFIVNSKSELFQVKLSSPKKSKKEKKIHRINDENAFESTSSMSSRTTNPTDLNCSLRSENSNETENSGESTQTIERTSPRKRKKKDKLDSDSIESESAIVVAKATDSDPNSHCITDAVSESVKSTETELPQRLRKKRKKLDKNSNVAESLSLADASENIPTSSDLQSTPADISTISDLSAKPLKSCLKKKKRKNKKKKNQQSNENSIEEEKKLSNRSVSFDNNVKIELIENCLTKSILAQEAKNTAANSRKKIKALAYLRRWKEDRQNWKFEKLTQLWLLKNMFNQDLVPSDEFNLLLEYIVDLKGAARNLVNDLCGEVISKMEQKAPEEEDKELEAVYPRARSVQQYLQ